jgi:hypothetical protein
MEVRLRENDHVGLLELELELSISQAKQAMPCHAAGAVQACMHMWGRAAGGSC